MTENVEKMITLHQEKETNLKVYFWTDSDLLSFPTIYRGKAQADSQDRSTPVHYSTIRKWELRSQQRGVAQSEPNTFYKF